MGYADDEVSVRSGKPVELYDFQFGITHWRYTSAAEDVAYMGHDYEATTIKRSEMEIAENVFKNDLEITVARDNPFAGQFVAGPVEGIVQLTIYRGHSGDFVTFWSGVIASVVFNSDEVKIIVSPRTTGMLRIGLIRRYQRACNHNLYGSSCKVNEASYKITGTIVTISGITITSPAFAAKEDGWFIGGKFVVGSAKRLIITHSGSTITLSRGIITAAVGNSFSAYAGCDHSMNTCRTKFDNLNNFGGFPWIPNKNPFSGDPVDVGTQERPDSGIIT